MRLPTHPLPSTVYDSNQPARDAIRAILLGGSGFGCVRAGFLPDLANETTHAVGMDWIPWTLFVLLSIAYVCTLLIIRRPVAEAIKSGRGVKVHLRPTGVTLEVEGQPSAHLVPEKPEDKKRLGVIVQVATLTGHADITLPSISMKGEGTVTPPKPEGDGSPSPPELS